MARLDLSPFTTHELELLEQRLRTSVETAINRAVKRETRRRLRRMSPKQHGRSRTNPHAVRKQVRRELALDGVEVTFATSQALVAATGASRAERAAVFAPFRKLLAHMVADDVRTQLDAFDTQAYLARSLERVARCIRTSKAPDLLACATSADVDAFVCSCSTRHLSVEALCRRFSGRSRVNVLADVRAFAKRNARVKAAFALLGHATAEEFAGSDEVGRAIGRLANTLQQRLRASLDDACLRELVVQNPRIERLLQAERRMRESILVTMPHEPPGAYPLARSMRRRFVLHVGPTNSGKTHDAMRALAAAGSGCYLGPLRLLAFEQSEALRERGVACSLLTGEEQQIVDGATHVASTIELADLACEVEVAVVDEAQMLADPDRGHRWTEAILGIPAWVVHVCLAPHALELVQELVLACGDELEVVRHERLVPLVAQQERYQLPQDLRAGDALVVFSRNEVHRVASLVADAGHAASLVYGALPHAVRHSEAARFAAAETEVVVATDAIGMGMNLPVRRVVFLQMDKYDGRAVRELAPEEVRQIAGRAGRFGIYDEGTYATTEDPERLRELFETRVPDLACARVGFSSRLLTVQGRVSELMGQWAAMDVAAPFAKDDMQATLSLVRTLERMCEGTGVAADGAAAKRLVHTFATMAFDQGDRMQTRLWKTMFSCALRDEVLPLKLPAEPPAGVRALEEQSALCDLKYQYYRLFGTDDDLRLIQSCRERIDERLREILSSGPRPQQTRARARRVHGPRP